MQNKPIVLIVIDGLRGDICHSKQVFSSLDNNHQLFSSRTVFPSNTLPCHASLFTSVIPSVHGVMHNDFHGLLCVPSLFGVLNSHQRTSGVFYSWQPLSTIWGDLVEEEIFIDCESLEPGVADQKLVEQCEQWVKDNHFDFMFFYFSQIDMTGHEYGWLSDQYMNACKHVENNLTRLLNVIPKNVTTIITSDHGGHGKGHGTDVDEDLCTPLWIDKTTLKQQKINFSEPASILDIAPTITQACGVKQPSIWQGQPLWSAGSESTVASPALHI